MEKLDKVQALQERGNRAAALSKELSKLLQFKTSGEHLVECKPGNPVPCDLLYEVIAEGLKVVINRKQRELDKLLGEPDNNL
jgi:hypothetical protein